MPTANITITVDYTAQELANMKEIFRNADGSTPTNAQLLVNIKVFLSKQLAQKYRGYMHDKQTAAIAAANLTLS